MKVRRILLLLGVLLVFVGTSPAAGGHAIESARSLDDAGDATRSDVAPEREGTEARRVVRASSLHDRCTGPGRRLGAHRSTLRALAPVDSLVEGHGSGTHVDMEAGARLLRAANTPCSTRGPPVAA